MPAHHASERSLPLPRFPRRSPLSGSDLAQVDVVTVDVFDTLLLRRPISERRRLWMLAERASTIIGPSRARRDAAALDTGILYWSRRTAQRLAFKALHAFDARGEVTLEDILARQAELLDLVEHEVEVLREAEMAVETQCLIPNRPLLLDLEAVRRSGRRVIAISDTIWSARMVRDLLGRVAGDVPLDAVHSSADQGATKRSGELFADVARIEGHELRRTHHIGDDAHADIAMGRRAGQGVTHLPRSAVHAVRRSSDGLGFEAAQAWRTRKHRRVVPSPPPSGERSLLETGSPSHDFASAILGPILAEVVLVLWLYLRSAEREGSAVALFCARGGLTLRTALERFLERTGLPLDMPHSDLMVSRVVAARAALGESRRRSQDWPVAAAELEREFAGASLRQVVQALSGYSPPPSAQWDTTQWDAAFTSSAFTSLLDSPEAAPVRRLIDLENERFVDHLNVARKGATRLILVDTGLYGSTLRLLREAHPQFAWEAALLARSNYKGFDAPHFSSTTGLLVERDHYTPFDPRCCVLRHWHLIEELFEPALASVTGFRSAKGGSVQSNLEIPDWRSRLVSSDRPYFKAALQHVETLDRRDIVGIPAAADRAWHQLKRMVVFPRATDVPLLRPGPRGRDFGRAEITGGVGTVTQGLSLKALRQSLWKEGDIAAHWPRMRLAGQAPLEIAYAIRGARHAIR
ncbi:hypothetical protein N9H93_01785 [Rhizobiaceae bacterium]|nr:hypothetical protein [Rhizobiaceae bacterium]